MEQCHGTKCKHTFDLKLQIVVKSDTLVTLPWENVYRVVEFLSASVLLWKLCLQMHLSGKLMVPLTMHVYMYFRLNGKLIKVSTMEIVNMF